jgi:Mlc titration factor MtfA (ptsG expression regulator)
MFGFRARRRRRILAEPFPAASQVVLHRDVGLYAPLDAGERARLRDELRVFIAETQWEAVQGFELHESMQIIVAANACLLTLAMDGEPLRHVRTVIIQPDVYVPPTPQVRDGVVHAGAPATGTAYVNGTVVLSWRHIRSQSRTPHDGRNVVLHEFAHQLDMIGGVVNGTPRLHSRKQYPAWHRVMQAEYDRLVHAARHGLPTLIDHYGATSPGEFFAVTTECFFERPVQMRELHPELYGVLRSYYRQDTARRLERI